MIVASIGWCWNQYYLYSLETGEHLLFSSPSYNGDGSWQHFTSYKKASEAADLGDNDFARDKGEIGFSEAFVEQVRSVPSGKFVPEQNAEGYCEAGYPGQEAHRASMLALIEEASAEE